VSWILPDAEVLKSFRVLETRTVIKLGASEPRPRLNLDKDPEKRRAYMREWYRQNREKARESQKAYEARHREKRNARKREWKKTQRAFALITGGES
jgi:hypothetical protein